MYTISGPIEVSLRKRSESSRANRFLTRMIAPEGHIIDPDNPKRVGNILAIERLPHRDFRSSRFGRKPAGERTAREREFIDEILRGDPDIYQKVAVKLYYADKNGNIKTRFAEILESDLVETVTFLNPNSFQERMNDSLRPPMASCGEENFNLLSATPEVLDKLADHISKREGEEVQRILTTYNIDLNTTLIPIGWRKKLKTALFHAVDKGHRDMVELLLRFGADANVRNDKGETPLMWAMRNKKENLDVIRALIPRTDLKSGGMPDGWSLLHEATKQELSSVIPAMLQHGADVNALYGTNETALHLGVNSGNPEVARELLKGGANADIQTGLKKRTPLFLAAERGDRAMVRLLLHHGADHTIPHWRRHTPLQSARNNGHNGVVEEIETFLRRNGTPPRTKSRRENTVRNPREPKLEPLREIDRRRETPLFYHIEHGDRDIVQEILRRGVEADDLSAAVFLAVEKGDNNMVGLLLRHGADINVRDKNGGNIPLNAGVQTGNTAVVRTLLREGKANPNIQVDIKKRTPLFLAAEGGDRAMVRLLLRHGADHTIPHWRGHTPLQSARNNGHDGVVEEIETFLRNRQ